MDPISHGIIGGAVYALLNNTSLDNPAFIGIIIGSIVPDLDIITKLKGDYVYLKHHRVESHSIAGIIPTAMAITLVLSVLFSAFIFKEVFLWTMIGVLSHILLDYMNSYGVALLYPMVRKKYSVNLITIYDPVITLVCGYILLLYKRRVSELLAIVVIITIYLLLKYIDRKRLSKVVKNYHSGMEGVKEVTLMPSEYNPISWNYLLSTKNVWIIGDISSIKRRPYPLQILEKEFDPMIEKSLEEELGVYFKDFTPYFHASVLRDKENICIKLTDIRYRIKKGFKHHATIHYNREAQLIKSFFHPFKLDNQIKIKK
ncbi:metal-dependent hydrolase [Alkaliphilus serpentinus]|uniref:Metal-dependent hydrolase n=1 Tax=Alkaliphilus serpentinus TaxID=1482731 RepID=A0A833MDI1_9FIRM|nr:metal-dependent hydrolase [Alkaliphilus serpentinus]KAB3529015.1 metal-dependent hydrolase [Alkaliphilus serpentinus]